MSNSLWVKLRIKVPKGGNSKIIKACSEKMNLERNRTTLLKILLQATLYGISKIQKPPILLHIINAKDYLSLTLSRLNWTTNFDKTRQGESSRHGIKHRLFFFNNQPLKSLINRGSYPFYIVKLQGSVSIYIYKNLTLLSS